LAINSADDERNPPETGITERELKRVKNGRLYLIAASEDTRGHATTGMAKFWSQQLQQLLQTAPRRTSEAAGRQYGDRNAYLAVWMCADRRRRRRCELLRAGGGDANRDCFTHGRSRRQALRRLWRLREDRREGVFLDRPRTSPQ